MAGKKKAVLIGDNERAQWHPLDRIGKVLNEILAGFDIVQLEDYEQFREENICRYDLCISFIDNFGQKLSDEQAAGLISYVCRGGGLLMIHNGISIGERYELAQLAGGRFTEHPEQKVLAYKPKRTGHIIMDGMESFSVKEEPYRFLFDNMAETTILLEYEYEGEMWPAAWAHSYGLGRVVYLSPGHNIETFLDPAFGKLVARSGLWAAGVL
ncbi:MAG: ThuA domain-containing protein [Bacillota bacterium]